jgi:DNA-binding transcriptional LysR family regulator
MGFKSEILHHRCAEMLDQGGGTIDWDDLRFVLVTGTVRIGAPDGFGSHFLAAGEIHRAVP